MGKTMEKKETVHFYTLTLNPAMDRTMYFDTFKAGELNRATEPSRLTPGSKGINVSRFLRQMGVSAPAYGFWGGEVGEQMLRMLRAEDIETRFVQTHAETRLNVKMIARDGTGTEANESGGPISGSECRVLLGAMTDQAKRNRDAGEKTFLFLGGSIPQGVEKDVYKSIVEKQEKLGVCTVLDCDGDALKAGICARPYLIKPNLAELCGLVGEPELTVEKAVEKSVEIYRKTGVRVLCTMGGNGAFYVGEEGVYTVDTPHVTVRGFTGAGDTFLAAFIWRRSAGDDIAAALACAAGAAGAKVTLPGSTMPSPEQVRQYAADRKVTCLASFSDGAPQTTGK